METEAKSRQKTPNPRIARDFVHFQVDLVEHAVDSRDAAFHHKQLGHALDRSAPAFLRYGTI